MNQLSGNNQWIRPTARWSLRRDPPIFWERLSMYLAPDIQFIVTDPDIWGFMWEEACG